VAVAVARDDPLTWIAAFAAFATLLGSVVWTTDGLVRTLLPLYALGGAAILGGCAQIARRRAVTGPGREPLSSLAAGRDYPVRSSLSWTRFFGLQSKDPTLDG